jgi:subtilisin family serine protease
VNGLVALLPRSRVDALAAEDAIAWVEPALPRMEGVSLAANDSNRVAIQADVLQAAPYSLSGAGVSVMVYDGGTARSTHDDFGGRLTVRDGSGLIDHATHVAATVGGSGAASGGTFRGMAPGVTIESYGFEYDGSGTFLFSNPGDFETDYASALALGADIANNSIGSNVEPNGFACSIQGDYGVMSSLIDAVVGGSLGAPFRIVWANGNERQGSRCDVEGFGDYYSIAPPAGAKNHITVGALNSNDDSMTSFSSWGPTDDGRMKPDISAPGCQSSADGGVTSAGASSNTSYVVFCGTSMASPTVCGISALLLEDHRVQIGGPDPLSSTLKVLLAHTAQDRWRRSRYHRSRREHSGHPDRYHSHRTTRGDPPLDIHSELGRTPAQ